MRLRSLCLLAAGTLLLAACVRSDSPSLGPEQDDADFVRATQLKRQDRNAEALAYFKKVISRRGDDAPESYLEAGLIYLENLKQPLDARYFLQRYVELKPNATNTDLVRQRIVAADREYARTIGLQPQGSSTELLELQTENQQLQRENEKLRAEIATLSGSGAGTVKRSEVILAPAAKGGNPVAPAPDSRVNIRLNPSPGPGGSTPATAPTSPEASPPSTSKAASSTGSGRTYTVVEGDTLYKICRDFYGSATNAQVEGIRQANRDVLRSGDGLVPGMVLRIP